MSGPRRRVARGRATSGRTVGAAWSQPRAGPCVRPDGISGQTSVAAGEAGLWRGRLLEVAAATGDAELEALGFPRGSAEAFETALDHDLVTRAGAIQLGFAAEPLWQRRYAEADRNGRFALAFCSDHGLELYRHYVLSWLATGALEQGRWDEAVDWADQIIRTPRASTSPRILALTTLGLVRARRGDPDPWSPLDEAYALGIVSGELGRMVRPAAALAEAAWLEGREAEIAELTQEAYELAHGAERRLGRWRTRHVAASGRFARRARRRLRGAAPMEIRGDHGAAAARWAELGCPYEAAIALAETGDEAAQHEAFDELQRLGLRQRSRVCVEPGCAGFRAARAEQRVRTRRT